MKTTVTLEGFHVVKHALRFNADVLELVTADRVALLDMLETYAPDLRDRVLQMITDVSQERFEIYSDIVIRTPIIGIAEIPDVSNFSMDRPIVLLENPRDQGNIGAVIRLSAGMDIVGVITTGDTDPWHKNCLRGSQGLHFALPVIRIDNLSQLQSIAPERPLYVFDETGDDITEIDIPHNAVLAFGSERQGVSYDLLQRATRVVKIPQQEKVSSYNLATSVAIGVYHTQYKFIN